MVFGAKATCEARAFGAGVAAAGESDAADDAEGARLSVRLGSSRADSDCDCPCDGPASLTPLRADTLCCNCSHTAHTREAQREGGYDESV